MKLSAALKSSNMAVRGITWLIAFLLLTMLWIMLLRLLPLNGVYQYIGSTGMTGTQSLVTMTLLPPAILIFMGWLGFRAIVQSLAPNVAAAVAAPAQASSIAQADEMLCIAAWSAITPFGDAAATIDGSRNQEKVFRPDGDVRDVDGHPVHSAAVKELPLEDLGYPSQARSRVMRITAMTVPVLDALHDQQEMLTKSIVAHVAVYWLIPAVMPADNEARSHFAAAWSRSRWRDVAYDLHILPASESAYGALNAMQLNAGPADMPYALLLAADSLIDPDELMMPLSKNLVFSGQALDGFVPAEGAAGLLLVDSAFATRSRLTGLCTLGPVHRGLRSSDRVVKGKADSSVLTNCVTEAMTASRIRAGEIGNVVGDTDHRFPRTAEVIDAMGKTLPELDPLSQRIAPMAYAGYFGAASDLIHIALAAELATASEQAALVVSVADVRQTAAAVIFPERA